MESTKRGFKKPEDSDSGDLRVFVGDNIDVLEAELDKLSYVHTQSSPSTEWIIDHHLGWYPGVTVLNSAGDKVYGEVNYESEERIIILFSAEFSGKAYLS